MWIRVDHHSGVPVYRQIIEQVTFHIASGLLATGEELPSVRVLSKELQVNPMTISKAFSFLEHDGLLERRPGRPLVVADQGEGLLQVQRHQLVADDVHALVTKARQVGLSVDEVTRLIRESWTEVDR